MNSRANSPPKPNKSRNSFAKATAGQDGQIRRTGTECGWANHSIDVTSRLRSKSPVTGEETAQACENLLEPTRNLFTTVTKRRMLEQEELLRWYCQLDNFC